MSVALLKLDTAIEPVLLIVPVNPKSVLFRTSKLPEMVRFSRNEFVFASTLIKPVPLVESVPPTIVALVSLVVEPVWASINPPALLKLPPPPPSSCKMPPLEARIVPWLIMFPAALGSMVSKLPTALELASIRPLA